MLYLHSTAVFIILLLIIRGMSYPPAETFSIACNHGLWVWLCALTLEYAKTETIALDWYPLLPLPLLRLSCYTFPDCTFFFLPGGAQMRQSISPCAKLFLVIEADQELADALLTIITQETSYRVCHARNGFEALRTVEKVKPDLFLLDEVLPGMDGLALFDRLHALPGLNKVPVIFLSASPRKPEFQTRQLLILDKPFELECLLTAFEAALSPPAPG
jgi:CheY-like chemotaxis protein